MASRYTFDVAAYTADAKAAQAADQPNPTPLDPKYKPKLVKKGVALAKPLSVPALETMERKVGAGLGAVHPLVAEDGRLVHVGGDDRQTG